MNEVRQEQRFERDGVLARRLSAIRRRRTARRALRGLARGAWLAAALLLIVRLAARVAPFGEALGPWTVIAPGLVVAATTALALVRRPETIHDAARAADRHYGLQERLVSAVEIAARPQRRGPFGRAIVHDAETRGRDVQPSQVVPLPVPLRLLTAVAAIGVVAILPLDALRGGSPTDGARRAGSGALTRELERAEERLDPDAEGGRLPYVTAARDEIRRLQDALASGETTPDEARRRFDEVLEHVARAYEQAGLSDPTRSEAAAASASARNRAVPEPGSQFVAPEDARPVPFEDAAERDPVVASPLRPDEDAPADAVEPRAEADGQGAGEGSASDLVRLGTGEGREPLPGPGQTPTEAAGEVIGAAQRSTEGASAIAGAGTQPLGDEDEPPLAEPERREEVALPEADHAEGRRIDLTVVPPTEPGAATRASAAVGSWRHAPERPGRRQPIDVAHVDVVRTYFSRPGPDAGP